MDSNGEIVQAGMDIKPKLTIEDAVQLARRLYGITVKEIREIIAYDDRNYQIQTDECVVSTKNKISKCLKSNSKIIKGKDNILLLPFTCNYVLFSLFYFCLFLESPRTQSSRTIGRMDMFWRLWTLMTPRKPVYLKLKTRHWFIWVSLFSLLFFVLFIVFGIQLKSTL